MSMNFHKIRCMEKELKIWKRKGGINIVEWCQTILPANSETSNLAAA